MHTVTDRLGRIRLRVSEGPAGGRCQVRTATTQSDPTVPVLRAMVVEHRPGGAKVALVPEGALLLASDAIEVDVTVDAGLELDLIEPGGTVAFDMRGGSARWDVRIHLGVGARLRWAGEPFVVAEGADVQRSLVVRAAPDASLLLRETLVLGRYGERPGRLRQTTTVVRDDGLPILVEDLPLNPDTAALLLGGHRVVCSVLAIGPEPVPADDGAPLADARFDLDVPGATLWRRLGSQFHESDLAPVWQWLATPVR